MNTWTNEMVEELKALHRQGFSASQSAERINKLFDVTITRNAVIGKKSRLGLVMVHGVNYSRRRGPQGWPGRDPIPTLRQSGQELQGTAEQLKKMAAEQAPKIQENRNWGGAWVPLMDRHEKGCCFPGDRDNSGERLYCNERRKPGLEYCEAHWAVMYRTI